MRYVLALLVAFITASIGVGPAGPNAILGPGSGGGGGPGGGTKTLVQAKLGVGTAGGGTSSDSVTFNVPITAGNTVVCAVMSYLGGGGGAVGPATASDGTNSYTIGDTVLGTDGFSNMTTIWFVSTAGTPSTVTANWTTPTTFTQLLCAEYHSTGAITLDGHTIQAQAAPGSGANAISSGAITTGSNGDEIIGFYANLSAGDQQPTAGTSFTLQLSDATLWNLSLEDRTQTTAGSVAATFSQALGNHNYLSAVVALR
jgi:hypothetical protein